MPHDAELGSIERCPRARTKPMVAMHVTCRNNGERASRAEPEPHPRPREGKLHRSIGRFTTREPITRCVKHATADSVCEKPVKH